MAEKILNTRIQLKYDTYENWITKNPVLKKGEPAFATLENNADGVQNAPTILIKVGDGKTAYKNLKFASAFAADVYDWAKADTKPSYTANEISGLDEYIAGEIQDTDTQYQIVSDVSNTDTNKAVYKLQSKAKGGSSWEDVSTFETPTEAKISSLINAAITALNLDNTYDAKGSAEAVNTALEEYKSLNDAAIAGVKGTAEDANKKIDAFLSVEEIGDATIDTLKEIQDYIKSDGEAAAEVTRKIGALESKAHEHENKEVLDGITSDKVAAWDSAETNAKEYADGLAKNYATAEQGKKADSALQSIATTVNGGLKVTGNNQIDIDDTVTFVFDCGDATI